MPCCLIWIFVLFFTGCQGGIDRTLEAKVEETYHLGPNVNLSVRNEEGSIRLYGAESEEVHLEAFKRAYSAERLNAIKVHASRHGESLAIETIFPPKEKWSLRDRSGTVDYVIIFPQDATISRLELTNGEISIDGLRTGSAQAMVMNGRLSARNCFGNLDYKVVNGAVDFYYNWWEMEAYHVKAAITNGGIGTFLPRGASFRLEAEMKHGNIATNIGRGGPIHQAGQRKLVTTIGLDDGPTFRFEAISGNIRIQGY